MDPDLRHELESLLGAREEAGRFLSPEELAGHVAELGFDSPSTLIGRTLGYYQVLGEIGAGAMGVVYRARDTRLGREVALKILPAEFTHDSTRVARFHQEARAASALNHLNIVTIHDIGEAGGAWFIAAELVAGITLRERMKAGKVPETNAIEITTQCAAALAAAHRAGIVHRDIKPENIMIRPDGVVKVVDFGLASVSETGPDSDTRTNGTAMIMGTPRYMSPEQARGQRLDSRTDILSLGSVLYEMLTARPAFPGQTAPEVFAALLGGKDPCLDDLPRPLRPILSKALAKDRDERYQTIEEFVGDLKAADPRVKQSMGPAKYHAPSILRYALATLLLSLVMAPGLWFYFERRTPLKEQDTVLLSDFRNQTADPAFDLTLKEGLAVQLEQSPRLNIFPETRVHETLGLMGRQSDTPITEDIAREICQRQGIKAIIRGSIASLGSHYAIALEAEDGHSGETLARALVEAGSKEHVLEALSRSAADMRRKLGESLGSVRKYDALLERTTSSFEALQAYSLGDRERRRGNSVGAIALFRQAVELDPQFAYAYSDLAASYRSRKRLGLAAQYAEKAYVLRDRVSEREKLRITSLYYEIVTGEIEKNIETLKLYSQIYPRDPLPHNSLGVNYSFLGQLDHAVEESRMAMRLDPDSASRFSTLAGDLIHLNRYAEAKAICEEALAKKWDSSGLHYELYQLALVAADGAAIEQFPQWFVGRDEENGAFDRQADSAAYFGQWQLSTTYANRAIAAAKLKSAKAGEPQELSAYYTAEAALRGAALGRCADARSLATQSFSLDSTSASLSRAALALVLCGETGEAQMRDLIRLYPKDTIVNAIWVPLLRAASEENRGFYDTAIDFLRPVAAYEAGALFWPQFLRGQAYLHLRKGVESAAEFRKILEHRGQMVNSALYPLAYLGQARAEVLLGDRTEARKSYQAFLQAWKEADAYLPSLAGAQKELAQLD
jgi:eukaryotic-like serine/threonine-protein kinase